MSYLPKLEDFTEAQREEVTERFFLSTHEMQRDIVFSLTIERDTLRTRLAELEAIVAKAVQWNRAFHAKSVTFMRDANRELRTAVLEYEAAESAGEAAKHGT